MSYTFWKRDSGVAVGCKFNEATDHTYNHCLDQSAARQIQFETLSTPEIDVQGHQWTISKNDVLFTLVSVTCSYTGVNKYMSL